MTINELEEYIELRAEVRDVIQALTSIEARINDTANGEANPRPPTGDDYNALWTHVNALRHVYEEESLPNNDREEALPWLRSAARYGGSFVSTFAEAVLHADMGNFAILAPALKAIMAKYPKYGKDHPKIYDGEPL